MVVLQKHGHSNQRQHDRDCQREYQFTGGGNRVSALVVTQGTPRLSAYRWITLS
jgi:hypothetical protein